MDITVAKAYVLVYFWFMRKNYLFSEFLGTGILVATILGSGNMGTNLSHDLGIALVVDALATVFVLGVLIVLLAPISGAHFNPLITITEMLFKRINKSTSLLYILAQFLGGFAGALLANLMFGHPAIYMSTHHHSGFHIFLGETVATAGLFCSSYLAKYEKREALIPFLATSWIGGAILFTSSASFANPAVTLARAFSNTFAGVDLSSTPLFFLAQIVGAGFGLATAMFLFRGVNESVKN